MNWCFAYYFTSLPAPQVSNLLAGFPKRRGPQIKFVGLPLHGLENNMNCHLNANPTRKSQRKSDGLKWGPDLRTTNHSTNNRLVVPKQLHSALPALTSKIVTHPYKTETAAIISHTSVYPMHDIQINCSYIKIWQVNYCTNISIFKKEKGLIRFITTEFICKDIFFDQDTEIVNSERFLKDRERQSA